MKTYNLFVLFFLSFILLTVKAFSADGHIMTFENTPSNLQIKEIESTFKVKLERLSEFENEYFKRAYKLTGKIDLLMFKKHNLVETVEEIIDIQSQSIIQATKASKLSNDPHMTYQWGLEFTNQVVLNELNDLENIVLQGNEKSDVNVSNLNLISKNMRRNVLVAVIDTGVDFKHPDLQSNIFKNLSECENGEIPFGAEKDNDNNKYIGDCKGWNFTGKKGSNRPEDFVGHGTHIAGIIAGVRNNNKGISGISNKIKILPIKALTNKSEESQGMGTSDRLAKSILYAITMKADVINLSLGWPLSFDKKHLQEAVKAAVEAGIAVVAASGNNDHAEPILPCAYEGVICVGSIDPDGKMSDFSNFGGHVDVLAPGNNILSTYPTANTPLFFDQNAYEIKSGTSQAAPYVSALAAVIKGTYPGISPDDLKAKIFQGSVRAFNKNGKYSNGGAINFDKSLNNPQQFVVRPNFKTLNRIAVDYTKQTFNFTLELKNYSNITGDVKARVDFGQEVILDKTEFEFLAIEEYSVLKLKISGEIKDLESNLFKSLKLYTTVNGFETMALNQIRFYVEYDQIPTKIVRKFVGGRLDEISKLSTINYNHIKVKNPAYYFSKEQKRGLLVVVYSSTEREIRKSGITVIPNATKLISIHRLDANGDGKLDYLVRSLANDMTKDAGEDGKRAKTIQYSYLSDRLRPLFGKNSHMQLGFEQVILQDLDDFALVPYRHPELGTIKVPVFMAYGEQPEADLHANPFARLRRRSFSSKIYYLQPKMVDGKMSLVTRTMNTIRFNNQVKRKIGFRPFDQIYLMKFYKQSFLDMENGEFKIILSVEGSTHLPRNYALTVTDLQESKWSITELGFDNIPLSDFVMERSINLQTEHWSDHSFNLDLLGNASITNNSWEQVVFTRENEVFLETVDQEKDFLQVPIQNFTSGDTSYRLFLTPSSIFMEVSTSETIEQFRTPVHVSSFLPGMLFREQHYPVIVRSGGNNYPAVYVDSTQIASRNIYTMVSKGKELFAPVSLNLNIPEKCKAKNPQIINGDDFHYALMCFDKKEVKMVYIPITLD